MPGGIDRRGPTRFTVTGPGEHIAFLPPESFLVYYQLLVEAVYLSTSPECEVKVELRRRGTKIPVRNYRAWRKLRQVDQRLYELRREIYQFLNEG